MYEEKRTVFIVFLVQSDAPPPSNAEEMVIERIIPLSAKNKAAAFVPTYDKNGEGVWESGGEARPSPYVCRAPGHSSYPIYGERRDKEFANVGHLLYAG